VPDNQNELTNRMRHRYTELHFAGVTDVYDVMAALAAVVREYDGHPSLVVRQAEEIAALKHALAKEQEARRLRDMSPAEANAWLIERDGGLNPS